MGLAQAPSGKKKLTLTDSVRKRMEELQGVTSDTLDPTRADQLVAEEQQKIQGASDARGELRSGKSNRSELEFDDARAEAFDPEQDFTTGHEYVKSGKPEVPVQHSYLPPNTMGLNEGYLAPEAPELVEAATKTSAPGVFSPVAEQAPVGINELPVALQASDAPLPVQDFEVAFGSAFDPTLPVDQAKMEQVQRARLKYPTATSNQLALKIFRGEFD